MDILSPAAVQLRELRRQALLDTVARERLAATAVSEPLPQEAVAVGSGSMSPSWRTELISRLSLLDWLARVAGITGRPLSRSSLWS